MFREERKTLENINYEIMNERTGFSSTGRETIENIGTIYCVKDCFTKTSVCQFSIFSMSLSKGNYSISSNEDSV